MTENNPNLEEVFNKINQMDILFSPKKKILKSIIFNKFPNLIGKDIHINNRIHDKYITPSELIYQNFKKEELNLIKNDPDYFKPEKYKESLETVDILRRRKLIDVLKEEDKIKGKIKRVRHVKSKCKSTSISQL